MSDEKKPEGLRTFPMFAKVRQIVKPIEGHIVAGRLADDGESIEYTVRHEAEHNGEVRDTHLNSRDLELIAALTDAEKVALQEMLAVERGEHAARDQAAGDKHEGEAK